MSFHLTHDNDMENGGYVLFGVRIRYLSIESLGTACLASNLMDFPTKLQIS